MAFEVAFLQLMPHSVSLASWAGFSTDGFGRPNFGTASTYRARVNHPRGADLRIFSTGKTMTDRRVAWIATTRAVTLRDQFSFEGSTFEIIRIEQPCDEDGIHHTKLWAGR